MDAAVIFLVKLAIVFVVGYLALSVVVAMLLSRWFCMQRDEHETSSIGAEMPPGTWPVERG